MAKKTIHQGKRAPKKGAKSSGKEGLNQHEQDARVAHTARSLNMFIGRRIADLEIAIEGFLVGVDRLDAVCRVHYVMRDLRGYLSMVEADRAAGAS